MLQGLDVVIFAVLKRYISEERDRWERETGESVGKVNFLTIFGRAHIRALTPDLAKTAFRKTGLLPFNRDVVLKAQMAPSKESSCKGHLPAPVAPRIGLLADLMKKMSIQTPKTSQEGDERTSDNTAHEHNPVVTSDCRPVFSAVSSALQLGPYLNISRVLNQLAESPLAYLLSPDTQITSELSPPPSAARPFLPPPPVFDLLYEPQTPIERCLLIEL